MVCCSVQSVPHHFLFLEYMISLFLSPALEQHQYIYWSLSRMASEKKPSCCHSLVWSIFCDCGRIGLIFYTSEWHVVVWYHHQAVEEGIVSCHSFCVHKPARTNKQLITLCTYAQQGYAFGRVGLCMYQYSTEETCVIIAPFNFLNYN